MNPPQGYPRWEIGSFFHFDYSRFSGSDWVNKEWILYGSGRDALKALAIFGVEKGWAKLHVPSYYCADVTESVRSIIPVEIYPYNFLTTESVFHINENEAFLAVEYFGRPCTAIVSGGVVILDVTHNPCTNNEYPRPPDYIFGSLRKTCSVPDGGFLCSGRGAPMPPVPSLTDFHHETATKIYEAMSLKSSYLEQRGAEKELYLELFRKGEERIGAGLTPSAPSALSRTLLPRFDLKSALEKRKASSKELKQKFRGEMWPFEIVDSEAFFIMLFNDGNDKTMSRTKLIEQNVYPAVLWQLNADECTYDDRDLSERVLMIQCDARYDSSDLEKVCAAIRSSIGDRGES